MVSVNDNFDEKNQEALVLILIRRIHELQHKLDEANEEIARLEENLLDEIQGR